MTVVNFSSNSTLDTTRTDLITVRPKLLLDFSNSTVLDPRITFTRSSGATRINARGLVETVGTNTPRFDYDPVTLACKGLLIEEQRTNQMLSNNSIYFSTAGIVQYRNQSAPDGSRGAAAYKGTGYVLAGGNVLAANTTYTVSIWAKLISGTSPTDGNIIAAEYNNGGYVRANLPYSTNPITSTWKRFSITFTNINAVTYNVYFDADTTSTSVIGLWGAQLEVGAFATSYVPATTTWTGRLSSGTYVGSDGLIKTAASGVARYEYNPFNLSAAPFLLTEPAGSNYLTYSEQFDNAIWNSRGNTTLVANSIIAPDGNLTADTLIETTAASAYHYQNLAQPKSTVVAAFTFSVYAKYKGREIILGLGDSGGTNGVTTRVDLLAGTITAAAAAYGTGWATPSSSILAMGNDWYRISITTTTDASNTVAIQIAFYNTIAATNTYNGDGVSGVYLWGAQLENTYIPTSYIATAASSGSRAADSYTTAQTTRAADIAVMTGTNFSNWYNQSEGTLYAQYVNGIQGSASATGQTPGVWAAADSTLGGPFNGYGVRLALVNNGSSAIQFSGRSGATIANAQPTPFGYLNAGTTYKTASAWNSGNIIFAISGVVGASVTNTVASLLTVQNIFHIGNQTVGGAPPYSLNGHIARIAYYNRRLSNVQIQQLTS